jgi:Ca2+-binding RTX toxin-like protein
MAGGTASIIVRDDDVNASATDLMNYDGGSTFAFGNAYTTSGNATVIGGDDFIDVRLVENTNGQINVYGVPHPDAGFNAGNDRVYGGANDDAIYGDAENIGSSHLDGHDTTFGGSGNDTIAAQDGDSIFL